jgi:hypothetical protein
MSLNKTFSGVVTNLNGGDALSFTSIAAKGIYANATNSSAVPSVLAGSGAFQYLRVNSTNTALEWATISVSSPITMSSGTIGFDLTAIDSTSIVVNSSTLERAALTGAIAASQNSNATLFSGIRDNGSAENDRTNLNFVSSTSATAVVTDDAGNDELEITFQRAALTGDVTASANSNTTAFRSFAAKSVLANATNASAVPSDLAGSAAFQYLRVNSANNALEWATLSNHASTSVVYNSNTFERAALTGDVTASQNSNATTIANGAVTLAKQADLAAGTVIGRQIDAGSGAPAALTGAEIAEIIRFANVTTEATGGTFDNHALDTLTDVWNITATSTVTGIAGGTAGRALWIHNGAAAGSGVTITINQFSGSSTAANRFLLPDSTTLVLQPGSGAFFLYVSSRWRCFAATGASATVRDGDKGDITVSSAGATWTVDESVFSSRASTSVVYSTTFERAALTGAIAASQNSNATVFAGIRDNGSSENDRTNLNFVSSTSNTLVVTDDSVNDELEITVQRAALTGDVTASANSNTTAFRSFSARSVLANATNSSAVPTELSSSTSYAYLRVNALGNGLEFSTISTTSPITNIGGATIGLDPTQNLGNNARVAVTRNSAATIGTRRKINFIEGSGVSLTVADDSANEEVEVTISTSPAAGWTAVEEPGAGPFNNYSTSGAQDIMFTGTGQVITGVSNTGFSKGSMIAISNQGSSPLTINDGDTNSTDVNRLNTVQDKNLLLVDDEVSLWARLDITSGATVSDRWMCLSHRPPFANCTDNVDKHKIVHNGTDWFATKSLGKHTDHYEFWEDFDAYEEDNPELNTTSVPYQMGNTLWFARSGGLNTGVMTFIAGEAGHPGIIRMSTGSTSGTFCTIHRGYSDRLGAIIAGTDILDFEAVIRFVDFGLGNVACSIGFSEDPSSVAITGTGNSHIAAFMYDTSNASLNTSLRCVTRESDGTATVTASGVTPTGWCKLRILQRTLGTIQFYINDALVATHSTQVPDSELLNIGLTVVTRTTDVRDMDVDYVGFISQPLSRF